MEFAFPLTLRIATAYAYAHRFERRWLRAEEGVDHRERTDAREREARSAADAAPVAHLRWRPAVPRGARIPSDRRGLQEGWHHANRLDARVMILVLYIEHLYSLLRLFPLLCLLFLLGYSNMTHPKYSNTVLY